MSLAQKSYYRWWKNRKKEPDEPFIPDTPELEKFNLPQADLLTTLPTHFGAADHASKAKLFIVEGQNKSAIINRFNNPPAGKIAAAKDKIVAYAGNNVFAACIMYQCTGTVTHGRFAITVAKKGMDDFLARISSGSAQYVRQTYKELFNGAVAFNLCYNAFNSTAERDAFAGSLIKLADANFEMISNARNVEDTLSGHRMEAVLGDGLLVALALHNYGVHGGKFRDQFKYHCEKVYKVTNWWIKSQTHHQGFDYMDERWIHLAHHMWAWKALTGKDIFTGDVMAMAYEHYYYTCSDGRPMPMGDTTAPNGKYKKHLASLILMASYYNDPILLKAVDHLSSRLTDNGGKDLSTKAVYENCMLFLFWPDGAPATGLNGADYPELPLIKYCPSPLGQKIFFRTGWDITANLSGNVQVFINMPEQTIGGHQHPFHSVQVYYKGRIVHDVNFYQANGTNAGYSKSPVEEFMKRSIAKHNALLVYKDSDYFKYQLCQSPANDGGEKWPIPEKYTGWKYAKCGSPDTGTPFADNSNPDNINITNRAELETPSKSHIDDVTNYTRMATPGSVYYNTSAMVAFIEQDRSHAFNKWQHPAGMNKRVNAAVLSEIVVKTNNVDFPVVIASIKKVDAVSTDHKKFQTYRCSSAISVSTEGMISHEKTTDGDTAKFFCKPLFPDGASFDEAEGYKLPGNGFNWDGKSLNNVSGSQQTVRFWDNGQPYYYAADLEHFPGVFDRYDARAQSEHGRNLMLIRFDTGKTFDMLITLSAPTASITTTEPDFRMLSTASQYKVFYGVDYVFVVCARHTADSLHIDTTINYTAPAGTYGHMLVNLAPGFWSVNGGAAIEVKDGQNTLQFFGAAGDYTITKT